MAAESGRDAGTAPDAGFAAKTAAQQMVEQGDDRLVVNIAPKNRLDQSQARRKIGLPEADRTANDHVRIWSAGRQPWKPSYLHRISARLQIKAL